MTPEEVASLQRFIESIEADADRLGAEQPGSVGRLVAPVYRAVAVQLRWHLRFMMGVQDIEPERQAKAPAGGA